MISILRAGCCYHCFRFSYHLDRRAFRTYRGNVYCDLPITSLNCSFGACDRPKTELAGHSSCRKNLFSNARAIALNLYGYSLGRPRSCTRVHGSVEKQTYIQMNTYQPISIGDGQTELPGLPWEIVGKYPKLIGRVSSIQTSIWRAVILSRFKSRYPIRR